MVVVILKFLSALLAFVLIVFGAWLVLILLTYFAVIMSAVVGLTGLSDYLKEVNGRSIGRLKNVFRNKNNSDKVDY